MTEAYDLKNSPILNFDESLLCPEVESVEAFKVQDRQIAFTIDRAVEYIKLPISEVEE